VVGSKFLVGFSTLDQRIRDHENGMSDSNQCAVLTTPARKAPVLSAEIGLLAARRCMSCLHQRRAEHLVSMTRLAREPLTPALVVARSDARPGTQMPGRRETREIGPDLAQDHLSGRLSHAGDRIQQLNQLPGRIKRAKCFADGFVHSRDALVQTVDLTQQLRKDQPLMRPHTPGKRLLELLPLLPKTPLCQESEYCRVEGAG